MKCNYCGIDLIEGFIHIPMGDIEMYDYEIKTCYNLKATVK